MLYSLDNSTTNNNVTPVDAWPSLKQSNIIREQVYSLEVNGRKYDIIQESSCYDETTYFDEEADRMIMVGTINPGTTAFHPIVSEITPREPLTYELKKMNSNYFGYESKYDKFSSLKNPGPDGIAANCLPLDSTLGVIFAIQKEDNKFSDYINWYSCYKIGKTNIFGQVSTKYDLEFQVTTSFTHR